MIDQTFEVRDIPSYEGIKAARWTWPIIWAMMLYTALIMTALVHFPEFKQREPSRYIKAQVVTLPAEPQSVRLPAKPQPESRSAKQKAAEKKEKKASVDKRTESVSKPPNVTAKSSEAKETTKPIVKQSVAKPHPAPAKQQAEKQHQDWLEQQWVSTLHELDEELAVEEKVTEKAAASYIQLIKSQVSRFWQYPPSARRTMEVVLEIRLIPTGEVIDAKVVRSSGNVALDRSARQALIKASPLPVPDDIRLFEKYFRTLTMPFRPEDARL